MRLLVFVGLAISGCAPRAMAMGDAALADHVEDERASAALDAREDHREDAAREAEAAVSLGDSATDATDVMDVMDAMDAGHAGDASSALRVLFVGNSYTYVNDLPAMLTTIAARSRPSIAITASSVTVGGATLQLHWDSSGARARLEERTWDAVVLQGQSLEPLWQPTVFAAYADRFGALATTVGARPLWFATWARRADSDVYAERWSGGAFDAMTTELERGYATAQMRNGGALVRVGEAWRRALAARPSLVLHDADGSHPTVAGTYLTACVFYEVMAGGELTTDREFAAGLSEDDAAALRSVAVDVGRGR
ncbi:MAG: hypothetical protein U0269_28335 [Polyangiales bacterium]